MSAPNVDVMVKLIEDPDAYGPQWRQLGLSLRKIAGEIAVALADIMDRFEQIVDGLELAPPDLSTCDRCLGSGQVCLNPDQVNPALWDIVNCPVCGGTGELT